MSVATPRRRGRAAGIAAAAALTLTACGDSPALEWTPEPTSTLDTGMTHREARQALSRLAREQGAVEVSQTVSPEWEVTVPTRTKVTGDTTFGDELRNFFSIAEAREEEPTDRTSWKSGLCLTATPEDVRLYEQQGTESDPMCDPTSAEAWWQLQDNGKWTLIEADEPNW